LLELPFPVLAQHRDRVRVERYLAAPLPFGEHSRDLDDGANDVNDTVLEVDVTKETAEEIEAGHVEIGADEFVESSRYYAGMLALSAIFERTGLDCEFRLFMYDDITKLLMPAFVEEPESTARGWEPGKGATGVAFSENRYVIATGDETHDETYGLIPRAAAEVQEAFST
jgi:hypothetical protein